MAEKQILSWKKAMDQGKLTAKENERLAVAMLTCSDFTNVDWDMCAKQSSTTKESFRVMFQGTIRKLTKAGCFVLPDDEYDAPGDGAAKETPKKAGGGKRKKADGDNASPIPRKRFTKKPKPAPLELCDDEAQAVQGTNEENDAKVKVEWDPLGEDLANGGEGI